MQKGHGVRNIKVRQKEKKVGRKKKKKKEKITTGARKQMAVTLDKLMRVDDIAWFLHEEEANEDLEEESHPTDPDIPPEVENEDSEEPVDEWDDEWSPWGEDSEMLDLMEFLRRRLDPTIAGYGEKQELIKKILRCSNAQQIAEIIWTDADEKFREHLLNLLAVYRFNYAHKPWISDEPILPDVIVDRRKINDKWQFEITVPDYYPDLADPGGYKELWEETLISFTELLIAQIPEFFEAGNWEEAEQILRKKSWTEIAFAQVWWKKQSKKSPKTKKSQKTPKTYRNLVSAICQHRYIYLRFFDKFLRFSIFFKNEKTTKQREAKKNVPRN